MNVGKYQSEESLAKLAVLEKKYNDEARLIRKLSLGDLAATFFVGLFTMLVSLVVLLIESRGLLRKGAVRAMARVLSNLKLAWRRILGYLSTN